MKAAYFTVVWNRGTPQLDACLDISALTPEEARYALVCKRLRTTAGNDTYKAIEKKGADLSASMAAIDIRMRFNPHHEGPFIVRADEDILDREAIETLIQGKHATGELDAWLDSARVSTPAVFRQA